MKDRRTIVRASMLVAALAVAMLLLFGIHIVMASPAPPAVLARTSLALRTARLTGAAAG
jgi:hypothetical protein